MRTHSLKLWSIIVMIALQLFAGNTYSQEKQSELGDTIKEIFVKGSINDDKLFLVLGMENAKDIAGSALKEAINLEDLRDLGDDSARMYQRMGRRIYNRGNNDVVGNISDSAEFAAEMAPEIFRWPWKSLKKIPKAHKIDMQRARDARANANNPVTAAMQYSGLAVWAKVKSAYYLVIEAPIGMAAALSATALAVPAVTAYELARIPVAFVLGTLGKTIRLGYMAAKAIVLGATAVATITYSAVSTGVAVAATTIAAGAIAAVKLTAKIVSAPLRIGKRAETKIKTNVNYSKLNEFAKTIKENINKDELDALGLNIESIEEDIMDYKAKIKIKSNLLKKAKTAMIIKVGIDFNSDKEKQNINLSTYVKHKHFNALKKKLGLSSKELKDLLKNTFEKVLNDVVNTYSQVGA